MTPLSVICTVVGSLLVLLALNDVFQTLLRPSGTGRLTLLVFRLTWSIRRSRRFAATGPLTILAVIASWVILVTVGWAFVYLPHVPEGFAYSGVDPTDYNPFAEAVTISIVALTTLGLGDVIPADPVLRFISPVESLTGFALLSASVSWFSQLYPTLARRRSFGVRVDSLREARVAEEWNTLSDRRVVDVLDQVSLGLAQLIADLVQNGEIFYFADREKRLSASRAMEYVVKLRDAALTSTDPDVRSQGKALKALVDELARILRSQYPHVSGESTEEIFTDAAAAHGHRIETE